jgi:dihydrofolate reductase
MTIRIVLVVAASLDRVIGRSNALPWHLPGDLKRFKARTLDKTVVMGRRTWDSIGRKPLPRRRNIVISRDPDFRAPGAEVARSFDHAISLADVGGVDGELVVLGGAGVYQDALPQASRIILSLVHTRVQDGDVHLPDLGDGWVVQDRQDHDDAIAVTDYVLERSTGPADARPPFVWPA